MTNEPGREEEGVGEQVSELVGVWLPDLMRTGGSRWPQKLELERATE